MRAIDCAPIEAALAARSEQAALETQRFKRAESWRDRLLAEGETALDGAHAMRRWTGRCDIHASRRERGEPWRVRRHRELFSTARARAAQREPMCRALQNRRFSASNAAMKPLVGIIMGSASDWETMRAAADTLEQLGVPYEVRVVSAHRTPDLLFEYASTARSARPRSHHRRRRRRGPSARHDGRQDHPARARRAGAVEDAERARFAALDRADAGGRAGRHVRDRRRRARSMPRSRPPRSSPTSTPPSVRRSTRIREQQTAQRPPASGSPQDLEPLMTIGIVGAGQLGRMLALAGYPLGLDFLFLDPAEGAPGGQVAPQIVRRVHGSAQLLAQLARDTRRAHVRLGERLGRSAAHAAARHAHLPARLRRSPHRRIAWRRSSCSSGCAFRPRAGAQSSPQRSCSARSQQIGLPGVLKTRRLGYDGKGQAVVRNVARCRARVARARRRAAASTRSGSRSTARCRSSARAAARRDRGVSAQRQRARGRHPAAHARAVRHAARCSVWRRATSQRVLDHFRYAGVLTIEFFVPRGQLIANEMAPRVHNSGHWTIEGAVTSQFENHLRAILGLPLGSTARARPQRHGQPHRRDAAACGRCSREPGVHLHDYGKTPRPGRKLGHCTLVEPIRAAARDRRARRLLAEIGPRHTLPLSSRAGPCTSSSSS